MTHQSWERLDNASNIFLAARTDSDPKVFRVTAELKHNVDQAILQQAVDEVYDRYPLYHAVLRRGVFWHYLQDSTLRPEVTTEQLPTCAPIYDSGRRTLLFRVTHYRQRINLEVFHALSDGTGALWFLTDVIAAYLQRHDPQPAEASTENQQTSLIQELTRDSFAEYFRPKHPSKKRARPPWKTDTTETDLRQPKTRKTTYFKGAYRIKGTRTPDHRTRLIELTVPAKPILALAHGESVSPTIYLTAMFFEALRTAAQPVGQSMTYGASIPVNLRQFFPSTSARNFFATVRIEHTYGSGDNDGVGCVARHLEQQFRTKATPEALETKLRRFSRFERMVAVRVVPRQIKDVLLRWINWGNNRGLTVAVSNLGRVNLPDPIEPFVHRMAFHVTAVRPQFCVMTHAGMMTISFTSPYVETDHVREFARHLRSLGVPVSVAAPRVTEEHLASVDEAQ